MTSPNHERMSSVDTAWLRMDSPGNAMMIVGVTATATPLHAADFRRMIESRFLCFPRFRHRPAQDPLGASWVEDEAFDLDAHLERVTLPAPAGKAELQALPPNSRVAPSIPAGRCGSSTSSSVTSAAAPGSCGSTTAMRTALQWCACCCR
jgi:Wax ester synthase-like Acyl-CoA acyltransferase domain